MIINVTSIKVINKEERKKKMQAIIFGAGNIGKGFLGLELSHAGYELSFVDVRQDVIEELRRKREYKIEYLDDVRERVRVPVRNAFHSSESESIDLCVKKSDLIVTAVGPQNLKYVANLIAEHVDGKIVIAAENAVNNSWILRDEVHKRRETTAIYPRCVVDRIAVFDAGMTKIEHAFEWTIEDICPDLHIPGVEYVYNIGAAVKRKLYVVNGPHAVLGFLGYAKGIVTPAEAMNDQDIRNTVQEMLREAAEAVRREYCFEKEVMDAYVEKTLHRFENRNIPDKTERLARDPVRKLGHAERLVGAALLAQKHQVPYAHITKGIVAALQYTNLQDQESKQIQDSIAKEGLLYTLKKVCELNEDNPLTKRIEEFFKK